MKGIALSEADRLQLEALGINEDQLTAQVEAFRRAAFFVSLDRPCTVGDGVRRISPAEIDRYTSLQEKAAREGRFMLFVPASGAASRMFQSLLRVHQDLCNPTQYDQQAASSDNSFQDLLRFTDEIRKFAFFEDLEMVLAKDGLSLDSLIRERQFRDILDYLLTPRGLNYGSLPKALLKFHRYQTECRTAIEEHLVDASHYLADEQGKCRLHFTVSPEHQDRFRELLDVAKQGYQQRHRVTYEVDYSLQDPSTNTIAVDLDNQPFRDCEGRLLFRPGGHGALIQNLNNLRGDLVYIKNIDNLIPDRLKSTAIMWKKALGGYLVDVQEKIHTLVRNIEKGMSPSDLETASRFAKERLLIHIPPDYETWQKEQKSRFLLSKLNRPIRVCGVVPNVGEPGGAPFWVENKKGEMSTQIVEKAQVNFDVPEQQEVWMSSTHFNPVDIVCALRDSNGKPFDLRRYVDTEAVFISRKSKDGRDLKALELPGLWNGAMADWITVVVEVPKVTFNPVKTVFDLIRPEHLS